MVTVCKINTEEPEEPLDFDFCSTNVTNKVILQSDSLKEAFSELDMTSEILQLTMSPGHPYFRYRYSDKYIFFDKHREAENDLNLNLINVK